MSDAGGDGALDQQNEEAPQPVLGVRAGIEGNPHDPRFRSGGYSFVCPGPSRLPYPLFQWPGPQAPLLDSRQSCCPLAPTGCNRV